MKVTQDQVLQLEGRLKRRGDTDCGEFVITSVEKLAPLLVPPLGAFERQYPAVCLRYPTSDRLFRLEFGQAHAAIGADAPPQEADHVMEPLFNRKC